MKLLQKIEKWVDYVGGFLIVITFSIMIISCIAQVYTRYVLNNSLSWTEELARYTFIWANLLAASFCVKNNGHARVTALFDLFPAKIQESLDFVIQALIIIMSVVLVKEGFNMVFTVKTQLSPAMGLNISLVYLAIPVTGILIILYSFFNFIQILVDKAVKGVNG